MDHRPAGLARLTVYLVLATLTVIALSVLSTRGWLPRRGPAAAPAGTWVSGNPDTGADSPATPVAAVPTAGATLAGGPAHVVLPTFTPLPTPAPGTASPTPARPPDQVGILAGHWQFDSGAVCADGYREVDLTQDVAIRVRNILTTAGIPAEILPEHNPGVPQAPLLGYRARALVALHADVCDLPGYSGFKVARGTHSTTPEQDDRLVDCLDQAYGAATLLPRHLDTISINMTNYYVFREIAADTPAAIIELGFLHDDRDLLTGNTYQVARGVADGILCFLRGECPARTRRWRVGATRTGGPRRARRWRVGGNDRPTRSRSPTPAPGGRARGPRPRRRG